MKHRNKIKILIIAIVIAIAGIFIYKGAIAPKLYDKYLNTGIKYLTDGQYEKAILAFDKAIKIEPKTTEARVYQAKAYVGNNEPNKAVKVLKEAQDIDIKNEELLKQILEILNQIDTNIAYQFLNKYVEAVGKDNISQSIKDILDSANEVPINPEVDPTPGTYINPVSVKLKFDKLRLGHNYYYTLDGSDPNKESNRYVEQIEINESATIKIIGYNKNNDSTDVITLEYIIDTNILENMKSSIDEGEALINNTTVGTEVGNISNADKQKLQSTISEANNLLNKDSLGYSDVSNMKNQIENAIKEFKNNIIKPTDKSKLNSAIATAEGLYNNSKEGSNNGQYKSGSKSLLKSEIDKAKAMYNNSSAKQNEIDAKVDVLNSAISTFKNSKVVSTFTKEKALKYATNKYGPPIRDNKYFNERDRLSNSDEWVKHEEKYDSYRNELCLSEYEFKSGQLTDNGRKYYIIEYSWGLYLDYCFFVHELKVYEDGTIKDKLIY